MSKGRRWSLAIGAVCAALVLGATVAVTTPAGAQLATNWNRIFKQEIRPRANKVYYRKARANKKFAPKPKVIRGTYTMGQSNSTTGGTPNVGQISFGFTLSEAPTPHYIAGGAPLPVGCSGTWERPNAAKGHLCVFEAYAENAEGQGVFLPDGNGLATTAFGASVAASPIADGVILVAGTWAVRPAGFSNVVPVLPAPRQGSGSVFGR